MNQALHLNEGDCEPCVADAVFDATPLRERARRAANSQRFRPESAIVADVIRHIQGLPAGHARKVHGGAHGQAGEPDIDACVTGRAVKLEGKTRREKPTAVQLAALRRWRASGALVGWFRSVQDAVDLLEHAADQNFEADLAQPGCGCELHGRAS